MDPKILAIVETNLPVAVAFAAGTLLGIGVEWLGALIRRRRWRRRSRHQQGETPGAVASGPWTAKPGSAAPKATDAADQLRIVLGAEFSAQPLLNGKEARVFRELDKMVIDCNPDWQVMAQVSLGEILRSRDAVAYACVNSKRVDLLLVDGNCRPRHAIEYQGLGHHQSMAAARDAVKKEALRRAGIGYHEVVAGHTTPSELRRLVERLVERPAAA
jgi:hypothetical protein